MKDKIPDRTIAEELTAEQIRKNADFIESYNKVAPASSRATDSDPLSVKTLEEVAKQEDERKMKFR